MGRTTETNRPRRSMWLMDNAQIPKCRKPVIPCRLVRHDDGSVIPSIHSRVREHFTMTARFRLLLPRTCSFLTSHPASWIDVQSLPRGCHFLVPIHQARTSTSHQQISCVAGNLQPAFPHVFTCFWLTDRTSPLTIDNSSITSSVDKEKYVCSWCIQAGCRIRLRSLSVGDKPRAPFGTSSLLTDALCGCLGKGGRELIRDSSLDGTYRRDGCHG